MGLRNILTVALKGKFLAAIFVATTVVGGATVAMASTPTGHQIISRATVMEKTATPVDHQGKSEHGAVTPGTKSHVTVTPGAKSHGQDQENNHDQQCTGLPEVQRLATKFSLSADSQSDDVQAICSLHIGKFEGTTTTGITVSTSTVYGYGEIDQMLTSAQFQANHDPGNMSGKLTSANARPYLADIIHRCGTTQLAVCLKTNKSDTHTSNNGKSDNSKGKPTATPTSKH
jgi:hypothetical protein